MNLNVYSTTDLMREAGKALAKRDAATLERLIELSHCWVQSAAEAQAQQLMLQSMLEAAHMLLLESTEVEFDEDEDHDEDGNYVGAVANENGWTA